MDSSLALDMVFLPTAPSSHSLKMLSTELKRSGFFLVMPPPRPRPSAETALLASAMMHKLQGVHMSAASTFISKVSSSKDEEKKKKRRRSFPFHLLPLSLLAIAELRD